MSDAAGDPSRWSYGPGELVVEDTDGTRYRFGKVPAAYRDRHKADPAEVVIGDEEDKQPKNAVMFEHPARGPDHCGGCSRFQAPNACAMVAGPIAPEDWCKLFEGK